MTDRSWRVMRQDDNGNRYVVAASLTHAEAQLMMTAFAARAHKQLYWVELTEAAAPGGRLAPAPRR